MSSIFAEAEAALAREYGHLTAGQAGWIAAGAFGGEVVLTRDLDRIPVPPRR